MQLEDVPRNDLAAAQRYYEAHAPISPGEFSVLFRLQDNAVLLEHAERHGWKVRPS